MKVLHLKRLLLLKLQQLLQRRLQKPNLQKRLKNPRLLWQSGIFFA
jgi:hypothetical protein